MNATSVVEDRSAPPLLLRALWFIFVGLWLGGIVTAAATAHRQRSLGLGAKASAIFISILMTARKRGDTLLETFRAIAGPSTLQAAGLPR